MRIHPIRPATAVLALCCFCLPWIEVRCNVPNQGLLVTSQSGLQMLYGDTSTTVAGKPATDVDRKNFSQQAGEREKPVLLMILCGGCLIATFVFSLLVPSQNGRWVLATVASGTAAGAMIIQLALGFPLVKDVPRGEGGWNYTAWFWFALISILAVFLVSLSERLMLPIAVGHGEADKGLTKSEAAG